ncbi:MgtC/SapB family protein [Desulfobulbus elongatus]|uniref:MgtC/SapB family protein n=1 Tax=Desulfobulbus elongatus TaxID=53332 RepID=UPI000684D2F0|nr:MgtC/SapB family protein [Desulfobulbus elongatus]
MVFDVQQLKELVATDQIQIAIHLVSALVVGSIIGGERTFHGRPAGFRTHTLVCLASSLLMMITYYQWKWLPGVPMDTVRTDPTRMAQGIMTGIGFLGAGVIYKEGRSVRGLTTSASIWITAAIGILLGVGFYFPAIVATALTVGVLSVFRWIEAKMPANFYAHHTLCFERNKVMGEEEVRSLLRQHGFTVANMSYRISDDGRFFEYKMVIGTIDQNKISRLADSLRNLDTVRTFRISPTGD